MNISKETQDYLNGLRKIMQLKDQTDLKSELQQAWERLQQIEYNHKLTQSTPYERRRFNAELALMQQNFAKVRAAKFPRKQFKFAARKLLPKTVENVKGQEADHVEFNSERLLQGVSNQTLSIPIQTGGDFCLQNCTSCVIDFPGTFDAIYLYNLRNCRIKIERVTGGLYVENCINCQFEATTHQLRIHNTFQTTFAISAESAPIIEKSNELVFSKHGAGGKWSEIRDFSWLKQGQNPHFQIAADQ